MSEQPRNTSIVPTLAAGAILVGVGALGSEIVNDAKHSARTAELDARERGIEYDEERLELREKANAVHVLSTLTDKVGSDAMQTCFSGPAHALALERSGTWEMDKSHYGNASILELAIANNDHAVVSAYDVNSHGGMLRAISSERNVNDLRLKYEYAIEHGMVTKEEVEEELNNIFLEDLAERDPVKNSRIFFFQKRDIQPFVDVVGFDPSRVNAKATEMIAAYIDSQSDEKYPLSDLRSALNGARESGYSPDMRVLTSSIVTVLHTTKEQERAIGYLKDSGIIAEKQGDTFHISLEGQ